MTGYGIDNNTSKSSKSEEDVEQKRLEEILKQSELTWKRGLAENGHSISNNDNSGGDTSDNKKKRSTDTKQASEDNKQEKDNDMLSLLSPELQAQFAGMSGDNTLLILPSKKKKQKTKKQLPPLTPSEIKAAKSLYKNTNRKLQQLAQRKLQKEQRFTLYKQLESNKVSDSNRSLLLKSSELGKKLTKKEQLKQLHKKELMGIKLTNDEMDVLYDTYDAPNSTSDELTNIQTTDGNGTDNTLGGDVDAKELVGIKAVLESKKRSKKKKKKKRKSLADTGEEQQDDTVTTEKNEEKPVVAKKARLDTGDAEKKVDSSATSSKIDEEQEEDTHAASSKPTTADNTETSTTAPIDYSSMMLASISSLKTKTDTSNEQIANEKLKKHKQQEEEIAKLEEEERKKRKVYVPTETVTVSSTVLGLGGGGGDQSTSSSSKNSTTSKLKQHTKVQTINRPLEVQESRYNLPVSTMEYEIIDAIRSNDCTILCGETGSGKSTQVPQFLYEAGFSQKQQQGVNSESTSESANKEDGHLLIGITQPRRVAAVSTAKRVAYEMGCGSGQSIPSNNLISYQTRYETAGLGTSTQIKFMTDGILLQEIQSDLLLRKYGAIIIDEESTALVLFLSYEFVLYLIAFTNHMF